MNPDDQKRVAAEGALDFVEEDMKLGLGTGSTAAHFVDFLGQRVADGLSVMCVATSKATAKQARGLNIPLTTLNEAGTLDLTVDGADELDAELRLIKGGGGALLHEKIVAAASNRTIIIADETKVVATLGKFPLPVEVVNFGGDATVTAIRKAAERVGCRGTITRRLDPEGANFETDSGHDIYDCAFGEITMPEALAVMLNAIPGVVDHGLFIGLAERAIIGTANGIREILRPPRSDVKES